MFINAFVFKEINGIAHLNGMLDMIMIMIAKYSPVLFIVALAVFYLYGVYRGDKLFRYAAVEAFAITVISLFIGSLIGIFSYEPRPFVTNHVNLLTPHASDASFPSDHSLGTMGIAVGINNSYKFFGKILILLSLLVGISRVYVGVHYPLDVLGSYLIVLVVNLIYRFFLRNKISDIYIGLEDYLVKYLVQGYSGK